MKAIKTFEGPCITGNNHFETFIDDDNNLQIIYLKSQYEICLLNLNDNTERTIAKSHGNVFGFDAFIMKKNGDLIASDHGQGINIFKRTSSGKYSQIRNTFPMSNYSNQEIK